MTPPAILTVTREGGQLYVQLTNQPRSAVLPKSNTEFFYKMGVFDVQISFETDQQGHASTLILHQGGRDQKFKRIEDAAAKRLEDTLTRHFKDQKAFPGGEAAIRVEIDEMQRRQPTYGRMTPEMADVARAHANDIEGLIGALGRLQSITFERVASGGVDLYLVKFEHGSLVWLILLDADGKVAGEQLRPILNSKPEQQ
jgi:hypothetical protein